MKPILDEPAYQLTWELDHFEKLDLDWRYDIEIVPFFGYDTSAIFDAQPFRYPVPILFQGYPDVIKLLDFPYPDNSWRVMSRRMYNVIRAAGDFKHRALPTAVVNSTLPQSDWFDQDGNLKPEVVLGDYVTLQLTEPLDCFDRERALFTPNPLFPDAIGDVREYAFKIPAGGLPPIFNLEGEDTRYFVSRAARIALREARICGPAYISLKGYAKSGMDEVDVEVGSL